jgi:hypothetical protein
MGRVAAIKVKLTEDHPTEQNKRLRLKLLIANQVIVLIEILHFSIFDF